MALADALGAAEGAADGAAEADAFAVALAVAVAEASGVEDAEGAAASGVPAGSQATKATAMTASRDSLFMGT